MLKTTKTNCQIKCAVIQSCPSALGKSWVFKAFQLLGWSKSDGLQGTRMILRAEFATEEAHSLVPITTSGEGSRSTPSLSERDGRCFLGKAEWPTLGRMIHPGPYRALKMKTCILNCTCKEIGNSAVCKTKVIHGQFRGFA